jgi:hypothetical protein
MDRADLMNLKDLLVRLKEHSDPRGFRDIDRVLYDVDRVLEKPEFREGSGGTAG